MKDKPDLLQGEFWVTNEDGVAEHVIRAFSAASAAQSVGEEQYHNSDYPEQQEFLVEQEIRFTARLKTQDRGQACDGNGCE